MTVRFKDLMEKVDEAITACSRLSQLREVSADQMDQIRDLMAMKSREANAFFVATLLADYRDGDMTDEMRQLQARRWLEALDDQPMWAVEAACRDYLSKPDVSRAYTPKPGEIIVLANNRTKMLRWHLAQPQIKARKIALERMFSGGKETRHA